MRVWCPPGMIVEFTVVHANPHCDRGADDSVSSGRFCADERDRTHTRRATGSRAVADRGSGTPPATDPQTDPRSRTCTTAGAHSAHLGRIGRGRDVRWRARFRSFDRGRSHRGRRVRLRSRRGRLGICRWRLSGSDPCRWPRGDRVVVCPRAGGGHAVRQHEGRARNLRRSHPRVSRRRRSVCAHLRRLHQSRRRDGHADSVSRSRGYLGGRVYVGWSRGGLPPV